MEFPDIGDLKSKIRFDDANGQIWLDEQRMLLLHASSFGRLRVELIESLGIEHAKAILFRLGFSSGKTDARLSKKVRSNACSDDVFAIGPQLQMLEGIVKVEPIDLHIDVEKGNYYADIRWHNSFEAMEHIREIGIQTESVCWSLLGYACGHTSEFMGKSILYKEVSCIGKGDPFCQVIGKPKEEWEDGIEMVADFSKGGSAEALDTVREEVQRLEESIRNEARADEIIGQSSGIRGTLKLLDKAAAVDVTVLLLGETGVGKETFSHALCKNGARKEKPFIAVNCAALPPDLIESELFGVEKGAFTGAEKSRPGRFERADGGTLFLDEIGELTGRAQAKLLRVLQTGEVERIGGTTVRKVNLRLIAATNADLETKVADQSFRADLYYRISVFPIVIPPLRERASDIPAMVQSFIREFDAQYGKGVTGISDLALEWLGAYPWPGNIRELRNVIERGVVLAENGSQIGTSQLNPSLEPDKGGAEDKIQRDGTLGTGGEEREAGSVETFLESGLSFDEMEKAILEAALRKTSENVSAAARLLKMGDAQFRYRLKKARELDGAE